MFHYPEPVRYYDSLTDCKNDVAGAPRDFDRNTMTGSEIACIRVREDRPRIAEQSARDHR
jgi:hypothetical protein